MLLRRRHGRRFRFVAKSLRETRSSSVETGAPSDGLIAYARADGTGTYYRVILAGKAVGTPWAVGGWLAKQAEIPSYRFGHGEAAR